MGPHQFLCEHLIHNTQTLRIVHRRAHPVLYAQVALVPTLALTLTLTLTLCAGGTSHTLSAILWAGVKRTTASLGIRIHQGLAQIVNLGKSKTGRTSP